MNRAEAVKALNVTPDEVDAIMEWASWLISFTPADQRNYVHYHSSWKLNPKLMVMAMEYQGKHIADTLLPLDELREYLDRFRRMNSMCEDLSRGYSAMLDKMIASVIDETNSP